VSEDSPLKIRMRELLIFAAEEAPMRYLKRDGQVDLEKVRADAIRSLAKMPTNNRSVEHGRA